MPVVILHTVKGIMRGPHSAGTAAGNGHGSNQRQRQIALLMVGALALTLASIHLASRLVPRRAPFPTELQTADPPAPALPDWLAAGNAASPANLGSYSSGGGGGGDSLEVDGAAFAAAIQLNPELEGVRGGPAEKAAALQRMRRWEHGLGVLRPLPPADIMAAAAVLFAAGGRLAPGSGVGPGAGSRLGSHALGLQSYYAPWILVDLAHWADSGISKELVEKAAKARERCHGSSLRLFTVNGTVWVDHLSPRPDPGWYPATLGEGWLSGKGRVPYAILTLMDVLREFGPLVPDVDIVMGCGDAPCSNLPKHELPAKPGRRRVHAAAAAGRAGIATTAAADQHAGGGGAGIRASGGRAASNDSGSAGGSSGSCQRRVNDFGSLLPGCGGCGGCSGCSGRDSSSEDSVRDGADGSEEVGSSDGSHGGGGRCLDPSDGISRRQALAVKDSGPAFPMFTYDTDAAHADIPFPDFSYWGHEFDRLWEGPGGYVMGWDAQQPLLARLSASRPWARRKPHVTWRGRHGPGRDWLRQEYIMCREAMLNESRTYDAGLFNFWYPDVALPQLSLYRYNVYIESGAWATNFKQKLASGSPVFAIDPHSPEFFSRALRPGKHYLPLSREDKCNETVAQIRAMDAAHELVHGRPAFFDPLSLLPAWRPFRRRSSTAAAALPGSASGKSSASRTGSAATGSSSTVGGNAPEGNGTAAANITHGATAGSRKLLAGAALVHSGSNGGTGRHAQRLMLQAAAGALPQEGAAAAPDAVFKKTEADVTPQPTEVAAAAHRFLTQHVRMADARRYLLDVLRVYAALQTFEVQPTENAVCYTGAALLSQFGIPHASDSANVSAKYPWLAGFAEGACPPERLPPTETKKKRKGAG